MFTLIGYLGSFVILLSYYLFTNGKLKLLNYYYLNALGCILSIIFSLAVLNGPMLILNLVFFVIGIMAIRKLKKDSLEVESC
jgi:hypothetical protein